MVIYKEQGGRKSAGVPSISKATVSAEYACLYQMEIMEIIKTRKFVSFPTSEKWLLAFLLNKIQIELNKIVLLLDNNYLVHFSKYLVRNSTFLKAFQITTWVISTHSVPSTQNANN